jgi:hypothetical protein
VKSGMALTGKQQHNLYGRASVPAPARRLRPSSNKAMYKKGPSSKGPSATSFSQLTTWQNAIYHERSRTDVRATARCGE